MTAILAFFAVALTVGGAFAQTIEGLAASGPFPEHAEKLMLFGQFVGDWDLDVVNHLPDGSRSPQPSRRGGGAPRLQEKTTKGEWHFGWVLEGRAIQDVWRVPPRAELETASDPPTGYGTTVRFYDPQIDAWHVTWNGVVTGSVFVFVARQQGDEIVMEAQGERELSRWIFSHIAKESFRWRAVVSTDGGTTWITEQEMVARRRPAPRR